MINDHIMFATKLQTSEYRLTDTKKRPMVALAFYENVVVASTSFEIKAILEAEEMKRLPRHL